MLNPDHRKVSQGLKGVVRVYYHEDLEYPIPLEESNEVRCRKYKPRFGRCWWPWWSMIKNVEQRAS